MPDLCSALQHTRLRLRSVSRSPLLQRTTGPLLYSKQEVESRRRQAEAQVEQSPASPVSVSPDPLGVFVPPQQRWWYSALVANTDLPTTIQAGIELTVLDEQDVTAGAIIEYMQATGKVEGPLEPDPSEGRVFILSKKGEHYLHTTKPGATLTEVATTLSAAQQEI